MPESPLSIKRNIVWNTVGNFIYLFTQWLVSYIVVQFLGFESAGILTLATTISGVIIGISLYGIRGFQVSDIEGKYSDCTYKLSRLVTSLAALLVGILFIMSNGYSPYLCLCILIYLCFKITESVSDVYQGILQKAMRMDYIGISFILKGFVTLFLFVLAVFLLNDLFAGILILSVSSAAIVILYDMQKARRFSQNRADTVHLASIKALLWECLPIAAYVLIFNAISLIPRYFLELQLGTAALGIYGTIAMPVVIVQVSASFIFSPLTTPFAQHLSEGNTREFFSLLKKVLLFIAVLSLASLLGFGLLGDWFLLLLFGPKIEPYAYLLMPLVICTILVAVSWFLSTLLVVLRKLRALLLASILSLIVIVVGSTPFVTIFGYNGASFILISGLSLFILTCVVAICMSRKIRNPEPAQKSNR